MPSWWPTLQENHFHYLVGVVLAVLCLFYLRSELTPKRVVSLFESENSLSIRLVLATAVVVFTLCMQAAGRLSAMQIEANYTFAAILLGLGTAKLVGKAFAERPPEIKVDSKHTDLHAKQVVNNAPDTPAKEEFNMNNLS